MMKYWLRPVLLLTLLFALPIYGVRMQPYEDRAALALMQEQCSAPCFMGIRPGTTKMSAAYYILADHDWVANQPDEFPSLIRDSALIGAWVPRTVVHWRWDTTIPEWIDGGQGGALTVEDQDVRDVSIDTRLLLGEILLTFGNPDESLFAATAGPAGRGFEYSAWYAEAGMFVSVRGACPARGYYTLPVQIRFRPAVHDTSGTDSDTSLAGRRPSACV